MSEHPYEGVISADGVEDAFWAAAEATRNDDTIYALDMPYFDREMDTVDGHMPPQFWEHMALALTTGD